MGVTAQPPAPFRHTTAQLLGNRRRDGKHGRLSMSFRGRRAPFRFFEVRTVPFVTLALFVLAALLLTPEPSEGQTSQNPSSSTSSGQATGQSGKGAITGNVVDTAGGLLLGALVSVQPGGYSTISDVQGQFNISNLPVGTYRVTVSYAGFSAFSQKVDLTAGQTVSVSAVLKVAPSDQSISVHGDLQGEAEQIQVQKTAADIVNVLSADVITSLPNANIADAVGRLPSVTLERDEGEGKYIQIRGTEPRLTNVTIDGINVPSPEGGVRQIKLDSMGSDLVESVEINKTLQANQDGDGIGGSVNLKTKTAEDVPTVTVYGLGGYTPIIGGRGVDQFGTTVGKRCGSE